MNTDLLEKCVTTGDFGQAFADCRVLLTFKGAMSPETLNMLGDILKLPDTDFAPSNASKKVLFAIIIEMAQNIFRYSTERRFIATLGHEIGVGTIHLHKSPQEYFIACTNPIASNLVKEIEARCKKINAMNKDTLRQYYLEQRKKSSVNGRGAGLGLIDIARRSNNPLKYSFDPIDAKHVYFTLSTRVQQM